MGWEMDYNEVVALNIRKYRREAGLTQAVLAERVGMSPQHLSKIERCASSPTVNTLVKIAACLGVEPARLFDEYDFDALVHMCF